jgi:hypothetical protein
VPRRSGPPICQRTFGHLLYFLGTLFQWTGGSIDVSQGTLTNASGGVLNLNPQIGSLQLSGSLGMVNDGTINLAGTNPLIIDNGSPVLTKAGTFDFTGDGSVATTTGSSFMNTGVLEKTGGTSTSTFSAILNNTGTVEARSGTLDMTNTVTQVSGNSLTGGSWQAFSNAVLTFLAEPPLTTLASGAKVTLSGANLGFTNVSGLGTIQ